MIISGKYKIESTKHDIIVSIKGLSRDGKEFWRAIGYFGCVASVLNFLVDDELLMTGLTDLQVIVERQKELYSLISKLTSEDIAGMKLKR